MREQPIRTLVVDDSALYRKFVSGALADIDGVDVVGTAPNGRIAIEKIAQLKPELITLDQEMPELDGIGLLQELSARDIDVSAIMISSQTDEGAKTTSTALQLGAFDFVLKPSGKGPEDSRLQLKDELTPKIEAFVASQQKRTRYCDAKGGNASGAAADTVIEMMNRSAEALQQPPEMIGIGVSTGGPAALNRLLPQLSGDFSCPIVLVQHMPPKFTKSLADDLNRLCALEVKEAAEGMIAKAGEILIAPGGSQMRIAKKGGEVTAQITDDPPERNCKPAVDYLFRSIATHFGERSIGVVLTGMGDDGTVGCKHLKEAGAKIFTQDEASCVVYGMPRSVYEAGLSDRAASLHEIADLLTGAVSMGLVS